MRGEKILQHRVRDRRQSHGEEDSGLKSAVIALLADGKAPEKGVETEHARLHGKALGGEVRPTVQEIAEPRKHSSWALPFPMKHAVSHGKCIS